MESTIDPAIRSRRKMLSVVAGCYNEAENIEEFVSRVGEVMSGLREYDYEIIVIDNASTDGTQAILRRLAAKQSSLKVILNARNFGHIRSPYYALLQAEGDAALAMASDLQDPPELIPQFLAKWEEGYNAVVGVKNKSEETALFFFLRR